MFCSENNIKECIKKIYTYIYGNKLNLRKFKRKEIAQKLSDNY